MHILVGISDTSPLKYYVYDYANDRVIVDTAAKFDTLYYWDFAHKQYKEIKADLLPHKIELFGDRYPVFNNDTVIKNKGIWVIGEHNSKGVALWGTDFKLYYMRHDVFMSGLTNLEIINNMTQAEWGAFEFLSLCDNELLQFKEQTIKKFESVKKRFQAFSSDKDKQRDLVVAALIQSLRNTQVSPSLALLLNGEDTELVDIDLSVLKFLNTGNCIAVALPSLNVCRTGFWMDARKLQYVALSRCNEISAYAFSGMPALNCVDLSRATGGVNIISRAFYDCPYLTEVILPVDAPVVIEADAFMRCSGLKEIVVPEWSTIKSNAFRQSGVETVTIKAGCKLASNSFASCNIKNLRIHRSVFNSLNAKIKEFIQESILNVEVF